MKGLVKFFVFRIVCPLFVFFRIDKILRAFSRHQRLIIYFHGVSLKNYYQIGGVHMHVDQFERLLRYIYDNFDIVPLEELCRKGKNQSRLARNTIAVTFDDGFLNNADVALPLLEKLGVPATFFVSSASLDDPQYIHPSSLVDLVKISTKGSPIEINGEKFIQRQNQLVVERNGTRILKYLNDLPFAAMESMVGEVRRKYGSRLTEFSPEFYRLLSADDVRRLSSSKMASVGSHGHYHVRMDVLSLAELKQQLAFSCKALQKCSFGPVKCLAFPYGNFNGEVVEAAEGNGFEYFFAAGSIETNHPRVFPRIGVLSMRGFSYNVLAINAGFGRFGF
jgi:peptidoglycan/xylan/chitin deacetylase (PgdA/CDA1 family)